MVDCTRDAGLPIPPPPPPEKAAIVSDLRQQTPQQQLFLFCEVERNKGFHCGGKGKVVGEREIGGVGGVEEGEGGGGCISNAIWCSLLVSYCALHLKFLSCPKYLNNTVLTFGQYSLKTWISLHQYLDSRHAAVVLCHTLVPFS